MVENAKTDLCENGAMDVRRAAEFTGVSRSSLYAMMTTGALPYVQVGKKRLLPKSALVRMLSAGLKGRVPVM